MLIAQRPIAQVTCQQKTCPLAALAAIQHNVCAISPPVIPTQRPDPQEAQNEVTQATESNLA